MMDLVFVSLLLLASYTDIRSREIPDIIPVSIGVISLFNFQFLGLFAVLPLLIVALIKEESIGGGDVKLVASVGLYLGFYITIIGVILALSMVILYSNFCGNIRRKALPLAPFLALGFGVGVV